eukprot:scaffold386064_cov36-Prasinocladus_malaysianus.AAC.1
MCGNRSSKGKLHDRGSGYRRCFVESFQTAGGVASLLDQPGLGGRGKLPCRRHVSETGHLYPDAAAKLTGIKGQRIAR